MDIHLTQLEITNFIEGTLDRTHREQMLEHLDRCWMCVKLLANQVRENTALSHLAKLSRSEVIREGMKMICRDG